jgi:hypothetical protein
MPLLEIFTPENFIPLRPNKANTHPTKNMIKGACEKAFSDVKIQRYAPTMEQRILGKSSRYG